MSHLLEPSLTQVTVLYVGHRNGQEAKQSKGCQNKHAASHIFAFSFQINGDDIV